MQDPTERFWLWFEDHQDELLDFEIDCEIDRERIFDELQIELTRISPHLTFEFGPKEEQREFVISAGGIREAFPAVTSLAASAPRLQRWRITAFRPRRSPLNSVQIGETLIEPSEVQFSLLTNGSNAGIHLFIPGFDENNIVFKQIGYLLLDDALGEYDMETKVGLIKMYPIESPVEYERFPFEVLPTRFDQLMARLRPESVY